METLCTIRIKINEQLFSKLLIFALIGIIILPVSDVFSDTTQASVTIIIPSPTIISITASDPNKIAGYSNGDTIIVRFTESTNMPPAATKTQLDTLFTFSEPLGNDYSGFYKNPSTLVITIKDKGSANPTIGVFTMTLNEDGNMINSNLTSLPSTDTSPPLDGDFGAIAGPFIANVIADDPNKNPDYSNMDTILVRFTDPTNSPGGSNIDNSIINNLIKFSEKLGEYTSGQWINPLNLKITVNNIADNQTPEIRKTVAEPAMIQPIKNLDGTSLPSIGISRTLSGDFGGYATDHEVNNDGSVVDTLPSGITMTVKMPSDSKGTITMETQTASNVIQGNTISFMGNPVDIILGNGASCYSGCNISFTFTKYDLPSGKNPADVKIFHDANNDMDFDDAGEQLITNIVENYTGVFTASATIHTTSLIGIGTIQTQLPTSSGGSGGGGGGSRQITSQLDTSTTSPTSPIKPTIYQISYDTCKNNQATILVNSNDVLTVQVRTDTNWISTARLADEQPYLSQKIKVFVAPLNPKDNSFKVYVDSLTTKSSTISELIAIKECTETIELAEFESSPNLEKIFNASYDENTFVIPYIMKGTIADMTVDENQKTVTFDVINSVNEKLNIKLPHNLVSAKEDQFTVMINDSITNYKVIRSSDDNTEIEITVPENSFALSVIGTNVVPEFGQISIIILAITIFGIITITQKKTLHINL